MTAFAAHLRVYEPLAAFPDDERRHWEAYAAGGTAPTREQARGLEREAAVLAAVARRLPEVEDAALVTDVDGVTLVSPLRLRRRVVSALVDFADGLPELVADAFVPRVLVEAAADELERSRPLGPQHVLTSTWSVPLRWFVLVDPEERTVSTGAVRTGRELVYRTAMSRARRRTARALAVLRRTLEESVVTEGVEELGRWLEEFHPRSLVELDYGGLVHLLDDAELQTDESARDVALALAALAEGDADRAAAAYGRVTARMKALQAVESAS